MKSFAKSLLAAAILAAAGSASAVVLTPDTLTSLPGTTVAANPNLAGMVLEDEIQAFSFASNGGTISGTVQSRVVRSIDGTLDFYWRVISDTFSSGPIQSFRLLNFFTSSYNADWRPDGLGNTSPENAYLFSSLPGAVNFEFAIQPGNNQFMPGRESYFMFLDTDALEYSKSGLYDLADMGQDEISQLYATFAPGAADVPEPATGALLAMGIAGLALSRRRKTKA